MFSFLTTLELSDSTFSSTLCKNLVYYVRSIGINEYLAVCSLAWIFSLILDFTAHILYVG